MTERRPGTDLGSSPPESKTLTLAPLRRPDYGPWENTFSRYTVDHLHFIKTGFQAGFYDADSQSAPDGIALFHEWVPEGVTAFSHTLQTEPVEIANAHTRQVSVFTATNHEHPILDHLKELFDHIFHPHHI